jgi:hypothetical protein
VVSRADSKRDPEQVGPELASRIVLMPDAAKNDEKLLHEIIEVMIRDAEAVEGTPRPLPGSGPTTPESGRTSRASRMFDGGRLNLSGRRPRSLARKER